MAYHLSTHKIYRHQTNKNKAYRIDFNATFSDAEFSDDDIRIESQSSEFGKKNG